MIDADLQFPEMMKRVERTIASAFPIESTGHIMELSNLEWKGFGNDVRDNITLHKDYKMKDKTLSTDLVGDITIRKKGGKVVDKKTGAVLLTLPHITNRASYIVNGNEVQTINQLRLRPGPYTRFTSDDNTETFINAAGGGYKIIFDRQTGVIRIKSGTTFVYIYPIMKALGVSDQAMQSAWGSVIFEANKKYDKREHVEKLFRTMRRFSAVPDNQVEVDQAVEDFFNSKRIDPKISKITLKKEFTSITPELLLDASRKAVDLAKGTAEMDDTESLAFKSIHSVEDFVPEKLERAVPSIRRQIQIKMDRIPVVETLISPRMFSNPVIDWFMTSEFTRYSDQQNPIDMAGTSQLTTTMGEGGIRSMHAVTDQVRTVHPSQMGFLDPLHTPEGGKIGVTGHLTIGAQKRGDSLFLTVLNARTGAQTQKSAQELEDATVAFNDQYVLDTGKPKPIASLIAARKAGKIQMVPSGEADFIFKDPRSFFSVASNAIPFLHNNSSNRGQMADRHIEQAVPLVNPDRPLVQARFKGDMGYDDYFGKYSNVAAPMAGTVTKVTDDLIRIKDQSDQTHDVRLHHNYPLNGGSFLTDRPVVVTGDRVTKGQVIAENNFTKDGSLALGKNLRTALIPYKGQNFEDGVVISQDAATKLTSEHKHEMRLDLTKDIKIGLDIWLAHYPDEVSKVNRGKYDTSGVIRKGSRIDRGDVLIPAVEQVQIHEEYDYARLHKALRRPWRNVAVTWESDYPGTVVDVVRTAKFIKVFIRTEEAAQVGDKLCYTPDHEVLTLSGWKPIAEVTLDDWVAVLDADGFLRYEQPYELHSYLIDENIYSLESQQVSLSVTTNHNLYVRKRGNKEHELIPAAECVGKRVRHKKDAKWDGSSVEKIVIPGYTVKCGQGGAATKMIEPSEFESRDFLRFLGFFIAEGNRCAPRRGSYRVSLSQNDGPNKVWIKRVLKRLGLGCSLPKGKVEFCHRGIWEWLDCVGDGAGNKHIPKLILGFSSDLLLCLWEGLHRGDGSISKSGSEIYYTSSRQLADQVQELALKVGWSGNIYTRFEAGWETIIKGKKTKANFDGLVVRIVKSKNQPMINHGHARTQNGQVEELRRYCGPVHCVTVPGHILYTRRNGKPVWCGNSNRAGGKGIIVNILPDNEMLRDESGQPLDVLFNPGGVAGRVNPGQIFEGAAGKVALKTGKQYLVDNFSEQSSLEMVKKNLKDAGMSDLESVTDPTSNNTVKDVFVGNVHFVKLQHQVSKKFSARGIGGYTADEQPSKVSGESAQNIGSGEIYALLASGSLHFLKDAATLKSQSNPEYWRAMQLGLPTPPPKQPFILDKFITSLEGAGINMKREGNSLKVLPMTDKETESRSKGEIKSPDVVRASDLRPERGGLFDKAVTGGIGGTSWSHIDLETPVPNPLMEKSVISVLGLKPAEYRAIMAGNLFVTQDGKFTADHQKGQPAGVGLKILLDNVNVNRELEKTIVAIRVARGARLNELNLRRRYLQALKASKMTPSEAYIQSKIPVIPPAFRPIYPLPDGSLNVADPNHSYREILMINNQLKDLAAKGVDNKNLAPIRADLFAAVQGMTGMMEPLTRSKNFRGFVSTIKGRVNKRGLFQGRVVKRPQDLSGRSTIIPDPQLGIDEMGMPAEMGLVIYKPFIVRRLVGLGYKPTEALDLIDKKDEKALEALRQEAKERPAYLNRAPTLHKFGIMPFHPKIMEGKAIRINPLIVRGYNADFDGDDQIGIVLLHLDQESLTFVEEQYGKRFLEDRDVTARYKCCVPAFQSGRLIMVDLADFPALQKFRTTEGRNGPIDWHKIPKGTSVIAYNESSGSLKWARATVWSKHYDRLVEIVELQSGRQIITDDDPRAVYGIVAGSLDFVRATPKEAVETGIFVPRMATAEVPDLEPEYIPARNIKGARLHLKERIDLTGDFGYLLGSLAGDGWPVFVHDDARGVSLAGIADEVVARCDRAVDSLFDGAAPECSPVDGKESYGESRRVTWTSVELGWFIHGLIGRGAENKHLPPWVFSCRKEFRFSVFAGLMDTDGGVGISKAKKKPQLMASYSSVSLRLVREVRLLAASLGIDSRITPSKTPAGEPFWVLSFSNIGIKEWGGSGLQNPDKIRKISETPVDPNSNVAARFDIVPISSGLAHEIRKVIKAPRDASKERKSIYVVLSKAITVGSMSRQIAVKILSMFKTFDHPDYERWKTIVRSGVKWDRVVSFERTGIKETGYDLTVPGFETFVSIDGLVLSNTMGVHVPVSEEARIEALSKMPSKQLFSVTDDSVIHTPTKEYVLGLYLMTKPIGPKVTAKNVSEMLDRFNKKEILVNQTVSILGKIWTPGQALVNDVFPSGMRPGNVIVNKSKMSALIEEAARTYPKEAGSVITKLKDLGAFYVTEIGYSVGLKDLEFNYVKRDKILADAAKKTPRIGFEAAYGQALGRLDNQVKGMKGNRFVLGNIESGAFGKADMVTQMIATPVAVRDHKNELIEVPIAKSFVEGHSITSYWSTIPGARKGLIEKGLGTAETGALSKRLINTTIEQIISIQDCGTLEGIMMPIESREAVDRVVSDGRNAGKILTQSLARQMKAAGKSQVKVRSPLTCRAQRGICAKCFGLLENGQFPPIGYHVGVLAGQAISEPMTQLMLKSFHTGGAMSRKMVGFDRIRQIMEMPENVPGKATIAMTTGTVDSITQAAGGGWIVKIDDVDHFIPKERGLGVKRGDRVLAGKTISKTGVVRPQDLLSATNDINVVRGRLIKDLENEFSQGGVRIKRKLFETVVKPMTDRSEVLDAGDGEKHEIFKGDIIPTNLIDETNKKIKQTGGRLIQFKPSLLSIRVAPYHSGDFVGKLMFERPHETISAAPRIGAKSDIATGHPITQYVFGQLGKKK